MAGRPIMTRPRPSGKRASTRVGGLAEIDRAKWAGTARTGFPVKLSAA